MRPPKKAQVKPAKGAAPKSQNTTGRIVNRTRPQTTKQAPNNPAADNYVEEFHDYLKSVKTPDQVKQQWGEVQKAKAAAEASGDRLGAMAAQRALDGLQEKANTMRMSVKDLPNVGMDPRQAMALGAALESAGDALAKVASTAAAKFYGKIMASRQAEAQAKAQAEAQAKAQAEVPAKAQAQSAKSPPPSRSPAPTPAPKQVPPPGSNAPKAKRGQGGYSKARVKQKPHRDCGKKLTYKDTKSVKGTGLQKDHTPSSKAIYTAAMDKMQALVDAERLTQSQAEAIATRATNNAPTIAIPSDVHKDGNTYGSKNRRAIEDEKLYERDAKDLNGAAKRDTQKISEAMADKKHGCNKAYNKAATEITNMDWNKYVGDAIKQGMNGR